MKITMLTTCEGHRLQFFTIDVRLDPKLYHCLTPPYDIVIPFDHVLWHRFDSPISGSSQNSVPLNKGYRITLLSNTDMFELSSVLRVLILSEVLMYPQPAFLAVIAALLSDCPTAFQTQLALFQRRSNGPRTNGHASIVQQRTDLLLKQLQSIEMDKFKNEIDSSFSAKSSSFWSSVSPAPPIYGPWIH